MITGESIPVSKEIGDIVISATVNQTSTIWIKATKVGTDTTISRIITLVQEAQSSKKAPIEEFADKVSHIFVPVVIAIAVFVFVVWVGCGGTGRIPSDWLDTDQNYVMFSLFFAISVMVVACPCAMGLASPTAIMVGTGIAAKLGILIKGGGEAIELTNKIDVIAFDKTGTLTFGKPKVIDSNFFYPKKPMENARQYEQLIIRIVGLVESSSDHPLAKAVAQFIMEQTMERNLNVSSYLETDKPVLDLPSNNVTLDTVTEVPGKGLEARVKVDFAPPSLSGSNHDTTSLYYDVFIGNERWLREHNCIYPAQIINQEAENTLWNWKLSGSSIVLVGLRNSSETKGGLILAQLAVADTPRPDAAKTVAALKSRGIDIWMITGDNPITAKAIAVQVGIENVLAEVSPEMKAEQVKWLQRRGASFYDESIEKSNLKAKVSRQFWRFKNSESKDQRRAIVAMIGDGINDSPALAQSDLPISIASATDVAIESSSIILTRSTLSSLITLIALSHSIIRRVRLNFLWAYLYNTLAIPIAAGVFFPVFHFALRPEIAGLAMAASSISVVLSSLLLKRFKEPLVPEIKTSSYGMAA
ncbi:1098_t:CDS:1 [Ambispora gerdemannii]|uniref:P-type Cu(+) transporter n=1 Tax=Ambispora gerdemannii TaxID=144530 RepID=A0A9N8Z5F1_9GLOM|nr:1098_t:CDS:1 [Ambispora gerdemannii]